MAKANFWSQRHTSGSYKSGLEEVNRDFLKNNGIAFGYESRKVKYVEPAKARIYTPDFFLYNGIIIETKGMFISRDRQKHLLVRDQNPSLEIRFVFSRLKAPIYKGSKTTCAKWCEKYGFKFAEKIIPIEWCNEPKNEEWIQAILNLKK